MKNLKPHKTDRQLPHNIENIPDCVGVTDFDSLFWKHGEGWDLGSKENILSLYSPSIKVFRHLWCHCPFLCSFLHLLYQYSFSMIKAKMAAARASPIPSFFSASLSTLQKPLKKSEEEDKEAGFWTPLVICSFGGKQKTDNNIRLRVMSITTLKLCTLPT